MTFDSDYGELVYFEGTPCPPGIVFLRFSPENSLEPAIMLQELFARDDIELIGYFTVLERTSIRRRPLPITAG